MSIKINVKKDDIGMRLKINEPSQLFAVNLNSEHKCTIFKNVQMKKQKRD
jgi:hypothetical protein